MFPLKINSKIVIRLNNNGGFILLSVIFAALFLSILLAVAMLGSTMQLKEVDSRRAIQESFYAAETAVEQAVFELRRNPAWSPGVSGQAALNSVRLNRVAGDDTSTIGFYSINVGDGGVFQGWNTRWVMAVGEDSLRVVKKNILARVIVENPSRFLVSTLGDLRIGSGARVDADIFAQDLFFEVNDSLGSPAKEINVNGDVFYIRSINGDTNPAVRFGPQSQRRQSPAMTFAGVDVNYYRWLAQNLRSANQAVYASNNLSVNLSNLDVLSNNLGGIFAPLIIFAEGDVRISGQYDNSMLVVAGGNIYLDGDVLPHTPPGTTVRPQIGLFAKKDLIIPSNVAQGQNGNMSVEAFVMADGEGSSNGVLIAQGPKFSKGILNFDGAIAVRGESRTGVDLNAFAVRNYTFNPELNNNRSIPFSPFIVNVIQWKEVPLNSPLPPTTP